MSLLRHLDINQYIITCQWLCLEWLHDSQCQNQPPDTDRLWCIGLYQDVITKTSQTMDICIKNVITDRMTLNDSCHKHA